MSIKCWNDLVPRDHSFHVSASLNEERMPIAYHGHDFAEVFWVEEGRGIHLLNNSRHKLSVGEITFIRPQDCHGYGACRESTLRLQNVAFPRSTLESTRRTYFRDSGRWPWRKGEMPMSLLLSSSQLSRLSQEVNDLLQAPRNRLSLDCFLLNLFRILGEPHHTHPNLPDWLDRAMRTFGTQPDDLTVGISRFVELAGRSPEHVARVIRQVCGKTPSSWVNDRRLEQATRLLESTSMPVGEVGAECGFENQSYFQKLYLQKFGISPLKYRQRHRQIL